MDKKLKAVLIAVLVIVLGGAGFLGYEYVTQKLTANDGIEMLSKGEYQKAYEAFEKAGGKKTIYRLKRFRLVKHHIILPGGIALSAEAL